MESLFGRQFATADEARAVIDALAQQLGYSLVKQRVRPNSVELRCSKGRKFKSQQNQELPASRRRETSSQMTGCPYRLVIGRRLGPGSLWTIRRTRNDSANEHNHDMVASAAHSRYRRMAVEKRKDRIMDMYEAGVTPIQILARIRQEDDDEVKGLTRYDIYNTILKYRRKDEGTECKVLVDE
ncbi:hypothetical protein ACHAQJ_001375 [Trichoderma viride]